MLLDKIVDLSGPVPESLSDLNYVLTSVCREILDMTDDEILENRVQKFTLSTVNNSFPIENKKILNVFRNSIACEEINMSEKHKAMTGSGSLEEATDLTPVFCISPIAYEGTNTNFYNSQLEIFPTASFTDSAEVFYVDYTIFGPGNLNLVTIDSLVDDLSSTIYDYWTFDMEKAFIIRTAMKILHIRLTETNIEEEDQEISQLVQSSLQSLSQEWNDIKNVMRGVNPDDMQQMKSLGSN
tara:strand:- start:23193 stop:23912 length:720 start_codon:yes stop_codon:yes gene_type:complete